MSRTRGGLLLVLLAACTPVRSPDMEFRYPAPAPDTVTAKPAARAVSLASASAIITAAGVRRHVAFLASDRLRSRPTPSPGLDTAAAYIARQFRQLGLEPAGGNGRYVQRWLLQRVALDRDAVRLRFESGRRGVTLRYGVDYVAVPGGGAVDGRAVFLGDAEHAPARLPALTDSIPLLRLHGSTPEEWRWSIMVHRPSILAGRNGVPALVFVLDADFDVSALSRVASAFEAPVEKASPVPVFLVSHAAAERALRAAGVDPAVLDARPSSTLPLKQLRVRATAPARAVGLKAPNVVAALPGADSARGEQYVILSAHFDHQGPGADAAGDSVHGAADDASGTAALLEIAAAFARLGHRPARPVLFLAVSGEEQGLLGSQWFATNPSVFLRHAVADLNLDRVGRSGRDTVGIVGYAYSTLGPLFDRVAGGHPGLHLAIGPDPEPGEHLFTLGDQYNFAGRGIPSVLVTTFPYADRRARKADRIDDGQVARIARLVFFAAHELAGGTTPEWTAAGRAAVH